MRTEKLIRQMIELAGKLGNSDREYVLGEGQSQENVRFFTPPDELYQKKIWETI